MTYASTDPVVHFETVDDLSDPAEAVKHMDAAAEYPAVTRLREWTAEQLGLRSGQRVIDVGCGPATAALRLAERVGPDGRVVGVDESQAMIDTARARAPGDAAIDLRVADATALPFDDDSFDAYRSERTYQWLSDPDRALDEALRVLRPGGRLVVTDTDWGTLAIDHPDRDLTARILAAPWPIPPNRHSGRRLPSMFRQRDVREPEVVADSIVVTSWDPTSTPGPSAMPPPAELVRMATAAGGLSSVDADRWLETLESEARAGRFFMSVTMFAVAGTAGSG
jgi:SAM-dependent methyltransferase